MDYKYAMKGTFLAFFFLFTLTLTSCATVARKGETSPTVAEEGIPQDHFAEIQAEPVPLVMNDRVQDWINYFQGNGRDRFERYLSRSGKYIPMMKRILRQYGLPDDLVYLAMIESGFNPHAYSRARATGTWQFIYRTGLRYGLQADGWIDERRDPEKSTVAAAKYLKDLYDRFNNWYLAAAGYNAGEGKIDRAIKRYRTEDFWQMARQSYLKRETRDYVPKMIAAAMISKDPERYGFAHVKYEEPVQFETVMIDTPTDLRVAAQCAGTTYEEIKGLNPELLQWVTPPGRTAYQLKVPVNAAESFQVRYAVLTPEERIAEKMYEVKKRETVRQVAHKHGLPVRLLAALNGYSSESGLAPGQTLLIPRSAPAGEKFREPVFERRRGHRTAVGGRGNMAYRVRRGDNLTRISRHLGVRASELKRLNPEINWSSLKYGSTLRLATAQRRATPAAKVETVVATRSAPEEGFLLHTVQAGETLWEIARKYNVTVSQIKKWNRLGNHRRLQAGHTLKILSPTVASVGTI